MKICPLELKQANELVNRLHRHHKPVQGHRFSIGLVVNDVLVGAAICGRPVARHYDPLKVLEVTRLVTDGTKNACSALYAAAARIAKEMGYERIQTYVLASENGVTLKAAGWLNEGKAGGGQWKHTNGKPRRTDQPIELKARWAKSLTS